ncbi:hypothetical protein GCM10009839_68290 [Catenulispora yoronensis]|uniref:ATP-binding protein n=1 Tax=Catenulispora yoronensis TaxID=450799 RepID=A0ABN2V563_9ACTN
MAEHGALTLVKDLLPHDSFPDVDLPRPIVILLGPRGSGRTHSLGVLAETLGPDIVHTRVDLAAVGDAGPLAVALAVVRGLTTSWPHRRQARFRRFEMVELALTADLDGVLTGARAGAMRGRFWKMAGASADVAVSRLLRGAAKSPDEARRLATAVQRVAPTGFTAATRAAAVRAAGAGLNLNQRLAWHAALNWIKTISLLSGTDSFGRLLQLAKLPPADQETVAMAALAEDLRENHTRLASADRVGCQWCHHDYQNHPRRLGHHWVLLADNADSAAGIRFLQTLHGLRSAAVRDAKPFPLLVIGTAGSWLPADVTGPWRPLCQTDPGYGAPVPTCATAREAWRDHGRPGYLPVRLDPARHEEMAALATAAKAVAA